MERGGNKEGWTERGIEEGETSVWDRETYQERKTPIWARERERVKHRSKRGAWGIWVCVWVWVWEKSRDKEIRLVWERKKKKHYNQLWWWWWWQSKRVELEAFSHEHVWEEKEEVLSFGRDRESFRRDGEPIFDRKVLGLKFFFWVCEFF